MNRQDAKDAKTRQGEHPGMQQSLMILKRFEKLLRFQHIHAELKAGGLMQ